MHNANIQSQTLLLVHAGNTGKRFIVQKLKKMGVTIVCLNRERVHSLEAYVDHWIIADLNNNKECVESIREFNAHHPRNRIDGAMTFWEECVLLTSRITDTFGLIGIPIAAAVQVKNKFAFRDFCIRHNLPSPSHRLLDSKKQIPQIAKSLKFPMVVKPMYGACSAFVVRANNQQELEDAYDYIKNNIKSFWLASEWENLELFVEEYIDGDEVDIDILLQNGKIKFFAVSDNFRKDQGKFFVDSGQAIPSNLPIQDQEDLMTMAEEILEKVGIQQGCIHFEAKVTKQGVCPIEINMRMGGDYIYSYVKGAWGVDLVEYAAKIALDQYVKITKRETPYKYLVGWDLQPDASGILVEQDVSEELNKKAYLDEMALFKEVGDAVLKPPEGYDSLGWITVSGDNFLDAQDNLKEALGLIQYKIVEFDDKSAVGKTSRKDSLSAAIITKNKLIQASKTVRLTSLPSQRSLHIGIAGNKSHFSHRTASSAIRAITNTVGYLLQERGYRTTTFDFNDVARAFNALRRSDVDMIVNVSEGINHDTSLKPQAAALIEALQIPYSGSDAFTIALCRDRIRTKKLLTYHNIPTPKWDYAYTVNDALRDDLRYPLIVKPSDVEESIGLTHCSIVVDKKQLRQAFKRIIVNLQKPAVVEECIEGDAYEVSIVGNREDDLKVLPIARSVFKKMPKGYRHITAVQGKGKARKKMNPKVESVITEIALDAYKIMRCQDYGRVELRIDRDDNPYVLDIDPNPPLDGRTQFLQSAKVMGMEFGGLMEEIIRIAIRRYQQRVS